MRAALALAAGLMLAGCAGSVPHSAAAPASTPAPASSVPAAPPSAPGAAFCASLKASGTPQVVYASEVERQVGLAGGGSVTPEVIEAARTLVAAWIAISCPQFAHLEQHG